MCVDDLGPDSTTTAGPVDRRGGVDPPRHRRLEGLEHQTVALEQRILLAGVDPPALEYFVAHPLALIDQPLDGVGDLEFATRVGFDRGDGLVDAG